MSPNHINLYVLVTSMHPNPINVWGPAAFIPQTPVLRTRRLVFKDVIYFCLVPLFFGGPGGGSGLSLSFRSRGFGPDPGGGGN